MITGMIDERKTGLFIPLPVVEEPPSIRSKTEEDVFVTFVF